MDGFRISGTNSASPAIEIARAQQDLTKGIQQVPQGGTESSFATTLQDAIQSVNQLQKTSDVEMQKLATGQSQNLHETMIAAEKADIALKLMVQMRNKMIEAYNEIMKMQV